MANINAPGQGVSAGEGLYPILTGYIIGNISGSTAPPYAIPITSIVADITIGSSIITGGVTTRILYDNAGVIGEYTITGTGTVVVMATGASLVTPALGVATATSIAIGGATLGATAFAVTGHLLLEGVTSTGATGTGALVFATSPVLVTPALGAATGTTLTLGGATLGGNVLAATGTTLFIGNSVVSAANNASVVSMSVYRSSLDYGIVISNNGSTGNSTIATAGAGATLSITCAGGIIANAGTISLGVTTATSYISGAPSGGTAGTWKLGIRVAQVVVFDTSQYVQLDIGGTAYKLAIAS